MDANPTMRRPGLPLDPVLQLYAGSIELLPDVTWTGGGSDPVAPTDPMRVALYVVPSLGTSPFALGPAGGTLAGLFNGSADPRPVVLHCRDYPGLVQGAWVGSGMIGNMVAVYCYRLSNHWV